MATLGRGIVLRQMDRLFRDGTLTGLGDGQLLERYLTSRDEEAFEALVDQHGPMVLGLCRRMLHDPRDIEDAFQATFLVLVQKAPGIRDGNLLSNWLYGVAYRVARRARSRTLRRRDRETAAGEPEAAASSEPDLAERTEWEAMLDQELSRLPEKYRAPLVLCYLRGRTHDQAAEELRCPVGTVRSRMARGRDLLRTRLVRRGIAPSATLSALGADPILSARLLVATVPPSLVATTVRTALAWGSSFTITAGAASLALAQGVLVTMRIQQFHWSALAAMATTLSATGVVAVALAASPAESSGTGRQAGDGARAADPQKAIPRPGDISVNEARLKALEDKIDRLSSQFLGEGASARGDRGPMAQDGVRALTPGDRQTSAAASRATHSSITDPIEELAARLKLAITEYEYAKRLAERKVVSVQETQRMLLKAQGVAGQVIALDHDFRDEMERLLIERRRNAAQNEKALARQEIAATVTARNRRLNERKPGTVGPEDVARAEAEYRVAAAELKITQADVDDVELRIRQLDRRRARLKDSLLLAEPTIGKRAEPTAGPAPLSSPPGP